jgi:hypothetical protein
MTCCNKSGKIWTTVTGFPDVKLTPYIGAVVLNVDLQSLEGVDSVVSHFADGTVFALSFNIESFELFLFSLLVAETDELDAPEVAFTASLEARIKI